MTPAERRSKRQERDRVRFAARSQMDRVRRAERERGRRGDISRNRPFAGLAIEAREDAEGVMVPTVIQIGNRSLENEGSLSSARMMDFILSIPENEIIVGCRSIYDFTLLCRDVPDYVMEEVFGFEDGGAERTYVPWQLPSGATYELLAIPGDHWSIRRGSRVRVVNEVGGFCRQSVLAAARMFDVPLGDDEDLVRVARERGASYPAVFAWTRALAAVMDRMRELCEEADIVPAAWRGAGRIATVLLRKHDVPRFREMPRPAALDRAVLTAYAGGRAETAIYGEIEGPVWHYDIHSAYPWAMTRLPCQRPGHGRWAQWRGMSSLKGDGVSLDRTFFRADVRGRDPGRWCHLPVRVRDQARDTLIWPVCGQGWYWSPEADAAAAAGMFVDSSSGWRWVPECDCRPWDWIEDLYQRRMEMGPAGEVVKLGMVALYGKLAQHRGRSPWRDYLQAGLVTAHIRARLIEAIALDPDAIIMTMTDGLLSTRRLPLPCGPGLGEWYETKVDGPLFILQSGIWWGGGRARARGFPALDRWHGPILDEWRAAAARGGEVVAHILNDRDWRADARQHDVRADCHIAVSVDLPVFWSHAAAREAGTQPGRWDTLRPKLGFDWRGRRVRPVREGNTMTTLPVYGNSERMSASYQVDEDSDFARIRDMMTGNPAWSK